MPAAHQKLEAAREKVRRRRRRHYLLDFHSSAFCTSDTCDGMLAAAVCHVSRFQLAPHSMSNAEAQARRSLPYPACTHSSALLLQCTGVCREVQPSAIMPFLTLYASCHLKGARVRCQGGGRA